MEHAILQAVCHDGKDNIIQMVNGRADASVKAAL
jgi:hypothetical protein